MSFYDKPIIDDFSPCSTSVAGNTLYILHNKTMWVVMG